MPPVTTDDAQQLAFPEGPHVAARPAQEGLTQVFASQTWPPLQSELPRHWTHEDAAPCGLHRGVPPPHAVHAAPQCASVVHAQTPLPLQSWFVPHAVSVFA